MKHCRNVGQVCRQLFDKYQELPDASASAVFGVTRVLAKLTKDGRSQAIMNDRKIGNALRAIDTWYPGADAGAPIAVEPYGANSHQGTAVRATTGSIFSAAKQVGDGAEMDPGLLAFYTACVIRGGVFGGKED